MKAAREIPFAGITDAHEAIRQILRVRFAECLEKAPALNGSDDDAIHAFRLACKRLRYAIERFDETKTALAPAAEALSRITDELGAAHDCVVLAKRARECEAALVERRALADRDRGVRRTSKIWQRAFEEHGVFEPLAAYTGFPWRTA